MLERFISCNNQACNHNAQVPVDVVASHIMQVHDDPHSPCSINTLCEPFYRTLQVLLYVLHGS